MSYLEHVPQHREEAMRGYQSLPQQKEKLLLRQNPRKGESLTKLASLNAFFFADIIKKIGAYSARDFTPLAPLTARARENLHKADKKFFPEELFDYLGREYGHLARVLGAPLLLPKEFGARYNVLEKRFLELSQVIPRAVQESSSVMQRFIEMKTMRETEPLLRDLQDAKFRFAPTPAPDKADEEFEYEDPERVDISLYNVRRAALHFQTVQVALQALAHPETAVRNGVPHERFKEAGTLLQKAAEDVDVLIDELSAKRIAGLRIQLATEYQNATAELLTLKGKEKSARRRELRTERTVLLEKIETLRTNRQTLVAFRRELGILRRAVRNVNSRVRSVGSKIERARKHLLNILTLNSIPNFLVSTAQTEIKRLEQKFKKEDEHGIPYAVRKKMKENQQRVLADLRELTDRWQRANDEVRKQPKPPTPKKQKIAKAA